MNLVVLVTCAGAYHDCLETVCNQCLESGNIRLVAIGKLIWFLILAGILTFILFEVNFVLDFGGIEVGELPDPAVEQAFESCYLERDEEIHATAFGTIDNPDVQKEFISASRAVANRECRELNPKLMIPTERKSSFNLVDLRSRFW